MKPGKELLFLALGGSGEIGMNVNLYGCEGKWVMVDLGLTFADPAYPGVELVLPDLAFIEERRDDLLGIVLTHGHEDHIGAIPYLAHDLGVPLYATPFTAGLIAGKLEEEGLTGQVKLNTVEMEGDFRLGPFGFRYIPLAHSIPEGNALLIDTPYGRVFHTGDWKLDDTPQLGDPSHRGGAARDRRRGRARSGLRFDQRLPGGVVGLRARRPQGARRRDPGRRLPRPRHHLRLQRGAAQDARPCRAGYGPPGLRRRPQPRPHPAAFRRASAISLIFLRRSTSTTAMRLPRREVMIIATGGQGEPRAALARIAFGQHKLEPRRAATSSSSRPSRSPATRSPSAASRTSWPRKGIEMITDRQAPVHVSGHPGRPELAAMYDWIRPEIIVPVHGEIRHMFEQARFARARGIPHGIVQKNGDLIRLAPNGPEKLSEERVGRLILDGDVILPADGTTMNERRRARASPGLISVAVALDDQDRVQGEVEIDLQGIPVEEDRDAFLDEACDAAADAVAQEQRQGGASSGSRPPRGAPLRHRMDRQEAGGQRADRPGLTMRWTSILAIYVLFWTLSLFLVLPFGVRTAEEAGAERPARPCRKRAARLQLRPRRAARDASSRRSCSALYYANYIYGWITVDDLDWLN